MCQYAALKTKGLRRIIISVLGGDHKSVCSPENKGLRPRNSRRPTLQMRSVCSPENKGIETLADDELILINRSVCSPENKGIETSCTASQSH